MTTELEKRFFDTFGIEQITKKGTLQRYDGTTQELVQTDYPKITDRVLLKLICAVTAWHLDNHEPFEVTAYTMERLKNDVLKECITLRTSKGLRGIIRDLFKGV